MYCNHYLSNEKLKSILKDCKYETFKYPNQSNLNSFDIRDTIHYKALVNNNFDMYNLYLDSTRQPEHSLDIFLNLKENFDIKKMKKIIINYEIEKRKYFIIDGVHRFSILLFKNIINDSIPLEYLEITYDSKSINLIKNQLSNTKNKKHYNGWDNKRGQYGYHSFNIFNINLGGQRRPINRIDILRNNIDFKNKNVLDFGCNTGGMLLHLFEIKNGIGIDFDINCIKAASEIYNILNFNNSINFIQMDLNNNDLNLDDNIKINIDIIFLFSLGSWIKNWKYIYGWSIKKSSIIFLESNNDKEGVEQLKFFSDNNCDIKMISDSSKDDITGNYGRKTYIIYTYFN